MSSCRESSIRILVLLFLRRILLWEDHRESGSTGVVRCRLALVEDRIAYIFGWGDSTTHGESALDCLVSSFSLAHGQWIPLLSLRSWWMCEEEDMQDCVRITNSRSTMESFRRMFNRFLFATHSWWWEDLIRVVEPAEKIIIHRYPII